MKIKEIWGLIRETFREWSEDKAPRLAAALAYYTVFSLAPLLVMVIAITGFIIGNNEQIREQIITQVESLVGAQGAEAVNTLIDNASQPRQGAVATIFSVVVLLIGATGVFGQLHDALNTIWEVKPKEGRGFMGVFKDRFLSFTMVLGICFLLLVSLVISTLLSVFNNYLSNVVGDISILAQIINIIISVGVITFIFALIFKILPDVEISWRDVWLGALVTAILFTIGKELLGLYLGSSATTSAYGAAASLVVLLLWVYYSAQILFLGAEFTQVYAHQHGSHIVPSESARALTENERAQEGATRREKPVERVQQAMVPVTAQPDIHPTQEGRETIRYEPRNPATVVPVIAAGTLAGIYTIGRLIRWLVS